MKLTKLDKDCFVTAVMADVPLVDYNELATQLVTIDVVSRLPKEVFTLWNDNTLRGFVRCNKYIDFPWPLSHAYLPDADGELSTSVKETLSDYAEKQKLQNNERSELRNKLESAIGACTTLKRAKEVLPEFETYLPKEREVTGVTNLPAIANLVTDLMNLGWPKDKEQPA